MSAAPTPLTFAPPLPLTPVRPTHADHAFAADPTPTLRVARDPRTSADEPTASPARFVWTVPQDSWWWSPGCYAAHGYRPDEVRPTTALFLSHRHRDDLYDYVDALHRAATRTGVVVFEHTTVDVQGTARPVVLLARSFADDGEVQAVHGELFPSARSTPPTSTTGSCRSSPPACRSARRGRRRCWSGAGDANRPRPPSA